MVPYQPMMPYGQYPMYQQPQPFQPMPQTQVQPKSFAPITGRVVNSVDDITVQEVPTDGTVAWFPSADGTCVYGKRWTPDGNITTMRFVPEAVEATPSQPDPFQVINDRISELFQLVEEIKDDMPMTVETCRTPTKREAVKTDAE